MLRVVVCTLRGPRGASGRIPDRCLTASISWRGCAGLRFLVSELRSGVADAIRAPSTTPTCRDYLDESVFLFNRCRSPSRGLLFYRDLQLAVDHDPVRYYDLIAQQKPEQRPRKPPQVPAAIRQLWNAHPPVKWIGQHPQRASRSRIQQVDTCIPWVKPFGWYRQSFVTDVRRESRRRWQLPLGARWCSLVVGDHSNPGAGQDLESG